MLKWETSTEKLFFKNFHYSVNSEKSEVLIFLEEDCVATIDLIAKRLKLTQRNGMFQQVNRFLLRNQEAFILITKAYFDGFKHGVMLAC